MSDDMAPALFATISITDGVKILLHYASAFSDFATDPKTYMPVLNQRGIGPLSERLETSIEIRRRTGVLVPRSVGKTSQ